MESQEASEGTDAKSQVVQLREWLEQKPHVPDNIGKIMR